MRSAGPLREYAAGQINRLLNTLAFQFHRAAKRPGSTEIHDLRVSIRRFSQGLLLFRDFFPGREVGKIERRLKRMLRLTSEIRNRDIALEFLKRSKQPAGRRRLEKQRQKHQRKFSKMAQRWNARDFSTGWRTGLSLRNV